MKLLPGDHASPSTNQSVGSEQKAISDTSSKISKFSRLTDNSLRWQVRVDMLRNMSTQRLTPRDKEVLFELLAHVPAEGTEEDWWVILNEIMDQLQRQQIDPERYPVEMLALIQEPGRHEIVRDYGIQHLGQWAIASAVSLPISPAESEEELVTEKEASSTIHQQYLPSLVETFTDLIQATDLAHTSIPGTTLNVLFDMRSRGVDQDLIASAVTQLAPWFAQAIEKELSLTALHNANLVTRVSAISSIGDFELSEFTPQIRQLAHTREVDSNIRLNALAALGQLGTESDVAPLQSLAGSSSKFRFAAQTALKKINQRILTSSDPIK